MYRGYEIVAHASFRVTRNSNLYFEEEEARSLLETIRVELHNRRKGDAVRLEIEADADAEIIERLRSAGVDADVIVGGIIPDADARLLEEAGVAAVYTPKDFEIVKIMDELVTLVERRRAASS